MFMQSSTKETNSIHDDHEYHDLSEQLREINRAIIRLILIKEDFENRISEYLTKKEQNNTELPA